MAATYAHLIWEAGDIAYWVKLSAQIVIGVSGGQGGYCPPSRRFKVGRSSSPFF